MQHFDSIVNEKESSSQECLHELFNVEEFIKKAEKQKIEEKAELARIRNSKENTPFSKVHMSRSVSCKKQIREESLDGELVPKKKFDIKIP